MKKNLCLIILLFTFFSIPVFADSWDDYADIDRMWDGQQSITNKEFEEAIDTIQHNQKQKEEKLKKKAIKKISGGGNSLHSDMDPMKTIQDVQQPTVKEDGMLVNVPVSLTIGGKILEKGFYNVFAQKDENEDIEILFYQSQFLKGKIPAYETDDDFGEETLDFARLLPYSNSFMKIIFGSIDFNAYAYIPYLED